jgi:hypothetical protein
MRRRRDLLVDRSSPTTETAFPDGGPETIADFFDTEAFPGKRAPAQASAGEHGMGADRRRRAADEVYEVLATDEGQARAFAKLDTISDIVWFDSWSQAPVLLNDGGAQMVQSANGRIFTPRSRTRAALQMVWDSHVYDLDVWSIVRGTRRRTSRSSSSFATGTVPLAGMQDVAYGPTRRSAQALLARGSSRTCRPPISTGREGRRHLLGRLRRIAGREVQRMAAASTACRTGTARISPTRRPAPPSPPTCASSSPNGGRGGSARN